MNGKCAFAIIIINVTISLGAWYFYKKNKTL